MIIENQKDVTKAVLSELQRATDPRFKEIMSALVRHLHDFAREVKLTEQEFQAAVGYIVAIGKQTNESHNEGVLMSGALGFSTLICLLNNGDNGQTEPSPNLLGPFWREHSPRTPNGGSIVRSPTPGPPTVRQRLVQGHERQSDRRRGGRRLAIVAGGLLREPGSGAGRHEPARQVHHRRGRPHQFPQHQTVRLSDSGRRPDRRTAARAGPRTTCGPRTCTSWPQAGLQDAGLAGLRTGRRSATSRPTCSSASPVS